jgi:hypothetical protein
MIINAETFFLITLDCQIKMHGGKGFNCDVVVDPVKGKYSFDYTFDTLEGSKTLRSVNQFQIAVFEPSFDGLCYVVHDADKDVFLMVRRNRAPENHNNQVYSEYEIGKTLKQAESTLRCWYPKHLGLQLYQPQPHQ